MLAFERGDFVLAAPWPMLIVVGIGALGLALAWAYTAPYLYRLLR